jgi:murein DD-endopeptidase MepM/ murein hydrolase activator NlpD
MTTSRKKLWWLLALVLLLPVAYLLVGVDLRPKVEYVAGNDADAIEAEVDSIPMSPNAYDIPMAGFVLEEGVVRSGATFGGLLGEHGVPMNTVHELVEQANPHFDVRRMRSGQPYAFIFSNDTDRTPNYFVYEQDAVEYVVFALQDSLSVRTGKRPVTTTEHSISTEVTGALYNDISRAGADPMLALQLADVYAWTVDFHKIQKGDVFTVVYSTKEVEGRPYGMPRILAARYTSDGRSKQAFRFEQPDGMQYFDEEGNSLRKAFLKAPLKFSRISSGYSAKRLHPVQKVMKAHLGTDYAAPYGTPILSVGDGTVEKTGFTSGNGNFVKIRHNGVYSTQYLHMRKILVKQGQRVQQGDVIGEVGSTGLATGPHVCFRFWKNGKQVDHRREEFPSAEPVAERALAEFDHLRDGYMRRLDRAERKAGQDRLAEF